MSNEQIAEYFELLAKLMDIHGDNSFKIKSYANAAFQIDRMEQPIVGIPVNEWAALRGIGKTTAQKIEEIVNTGQLKALQHYIDSTPAGVIEMLKIKGLGAKKIHTIWKEMNIESMGELLYACNENRLSLLKGFGEKTQQNIKDAIHFLMSQQGKFLYQQAEPFIIVYEKKLAGFFGDRLVGLTGNARRQTEILEAIEFVITASPENIKSVLENAGFKASGNLESESLTYTFENAPDLLIHSCTPANAIKALMQTTGSSAFIATLENKAGKKLEEIEANTEADVFVQVQLPYLPPCVRETSATINRFIENKSTELISVKDIKGIIHTHSTWSDGAQTIEEMASKAQEQGFEYLVISDHSKSATYAKGLSVERIVQQAEAIDKLNATNPAFRIFKSIECDILGDGSLDYEEDVLAGFDLVIASIHSSLRMSEEKAMSRLIRAIENPYTLILGHMTGRLLLSRNGYPVNHQKIIDACAANEVVIELNAHPRRLDIDWQWIPYARQKEVLISINPDAHHTDGYGDIKYGVLAAQKGALTPNGNLSSFSLAEFNEWLFETRLNKCTAMEG